MSIRATRRLLALLYPKWDTNPYAYSKSIRASCLIKKNGNNLSNPECVYLLETEVLIIRNWELIMTCINNTVMRLHISILSPKFRKNLSHAIWIPFEFIWLGVSKKNGKPPQIIHFNRVWNHYKPSILGGFLPIFGNTHISSTIFPTKK